jgi:hypothetical protein
MSLRLETGERIVNRIRSAKARVQELQAEDEDLPVRYLLYAALVIVVLAGVAVTTFFVLVR